MAAVHPRLVRTRLRHLHRHLRRKLVIVSVSVLVKPLFRDLSGFLLCAGSHGDKLCVWAGHTEAGGELNGPPDSLSTKLCVW